MTELTAVGIDYTKVTPLQQKRVHSFLSQYTSQTVCYLNRLSAACEEQLESNDRELQRLDATLSVLESKLQSLPDQPAAAAATADQSQQQQQHQANGQSEQTVPVGGPSPQQQQQAGSSSQQQEQQQQQQQEQQQPQQEPEQPKQRVADHPVYAGFFKMLKVGVPIPAIKAKMQLSGADPSVLDLDPDSPVPADWVEQQKGEEDEFSD